MNNNIKRFDLFTYFKDRKIIIVVGVIALLGIFLLLIPTNNRADANLSSNDDRMKAYTESLENKIAEFCSKVRGVSNVQVTVYFDSGFETIYAFDEESKTTSSGTNSEKKYVTIGSGSAESMVCVVEKMPNICGIAVVCKGGGNALVANEIINLISSAYGVSKNKIYVAEGKN